MKTALLVICFIVVCAFIAQVEISFSPFRIRAHAWANLLGFVLIYFGFMFLVYHEYGKGYKKGAEDVVKFMIEKNESESVEP